MPKKVVKKQTHPKCVDLIYKLKQWIANYVDSVIQGIVSALLCTPSVLEHK